MCFENSFRCRFASSVIVWVATMLVGCARRPPPAPFIAAPVRLAEDHFIGSPLTGPLAKPLTSTNPADALAVNVSIYAIERSEIGVALPLTASARMIIVTRSGLPVQASSRLVQTGKLVGGEAAEKLRRAVSSTQPSPSFGRSAAIDGFRTALPVGVTGRFRLADPASRRDIEVSLYRPDEKSPIQVAVAMEDLLSPPAPIIDTTPQEPPKPRRGLFGKFFPARPKPATAPSTRPAAPPVPVREMVMFDRPVADDRDAFAMMLPFTAGQGEGVVIFVDIAPASADEAHAKAFAKCLDDLKQSGALATTRPYLEAVDNPQWPALNAALSAMAQPGAPMRPMVFLASQTKAGLFEDVALVADEEIRTALVAKIFARLGEPTKVHTTESLGWILDAATYELLSERSSGARLPEELMAVLTLHAGEAARHPGSLDDALKNSRGHSDFDLRLISENYIYLEDSSPASRVRAFDWLTAIGRAPAGYDPLGPPKARRAALEKALAPTTAPGGTP